MNTQEGFPRYDTYQDSGIDWVGDIPSHWSTQKGKWLFEKRERPVRQEDDIVTAFRDGMVTLRSNRRTEGFTNAVQEHGYQGIRKGDLVIHAMDAFAGAIGVSDSDGKATPVYAACVNRGEFDTNSHYYAYLLRFMSKAGYIEALAKGIRERSTDFRFNDFGKLLLPLPPKDEQDRIANFLDQKTAEIDEAIAKKKRLIELLKEQKAILINQAVTKGMNPGVPMRDSGVAWIGEVPEHWEPKKLKHLCEILDCKHLTAPFVAEGVPLASLREVQSKKINLATANMTTPKFFKKLIEGGRKPQQGDIIYSRNVTVGFASLVDVNREFGMGQDVCLLRPSLTDGMYLVHQLMSNMVQEQIRQLLIGSTFNRINISQIKELVVIQPPLEEQKAISNHIDAVELEYSELTQAIQREIAALQEWASVVVSNAVTGKIKL